MRTRAAILAAAGVVLCARAVDAQAPARRGAPAVTAPSPALAPPRRLQGYEIEGERLDSDERLRGFFDLALPVGNVWKADEEREFATFCASLGYFVTIRNEPVGDAGVIAHLRLRPITLVRHIDIEITGIGYLGGLLQDKIFRQDIQRRMRLQIGSPLPSDARSRRKRLRIEQARVEDYLQDQGFFEAAVRITPVADGRSAVRLAVDVRTGPAYYVGRVRIAGAREVSDDEIRAKFHHKRLTVPFTNIGGWKRRFSAAQLKRDLDAVVRLYQSRGFPGVRVRSDFDRKTSFHRNRHEVDFTVIIRERRRVEVVFEGNEAKPERALREQLTLDAEGSYDDFEIQRSAQAIRRYYQQDGYFEALVQPERVSFRLPDQRFDRVVFSIEEGPKLRVRDIEFVVHPHAGAVPQMTEAGLRALIKTREYPKIFLASGGYASSLQLEQDVQRISSAYRARGYADVQVHYEVSRARKLVGSAPALAAAIVSETPADGLYVRFLIDEGARQRVDTVQFSFGHQSIRADGTVAFARADRHIKTAAELRTVTRLRPGSPFTERRANQDGDAIQRYYFREGHPRAKVRTYTKRLASGRIVVVHEIDEGRAVRFGEVAVRGNFKTREWVIRQELKLAKGAPFTLGRADAAQRNLRGSGLFSNVRFHYVGLEDPTKDLVNVVLNVQERYDYWFDYGASAGYATDTKFFAELEQTAPHILGTGVRLELRERVGQEQNRVDGKLVIPRWVQRHWLGVPLRVEASGYWLQEVTERFGDLTSLGATIGAGIEGEVGGPWDGWFLGVRYDFRRRAREEELVRIAGPSDDIEQARVRTNTGAIGPQLVIDKRTGPGGRRNPLAPEAGFRIEGIALLADGALGGDDRFIKLGFKGLYYLKLGDRFLLTNGLRYDHGIPLAGAVLLPEVERFFAGGDTTVRGFEEDRMHTEIIREPVPPLDGVTQFRVLPAGGNIRLIHNIELQVQVWDKSFIAGLPWASALFVDTGLVANSLDGIGVRDLRHALGIAFWRLVTPAGSFSFEWAIPLDPQTGDNPRGRLHLNLGFVFK